MSGMSYKDMVLPEKLQMDEKSATDSYAKFIAEPYESGYGHTVGNSLRRILLSSLEGAAVTAVRIEGAIHEYSSLKGVREDVIDILLNLKKLRLRLFSGETETIFLSMKKAGPVTGAHVQENSNVEIVNKDLVIANLEPGGKLDIEIEIAKGRGYMPTEELRSRMNWPVGFIPVDALFAPVQKVHYDVENARVGQRTDYDRLVLEIWTDGTIHPREALHQTAALLRKSLVTFLPEDELKRSALPGEAAGDAASNGSDGALTDSKIKDLITQSVDVIELSSRASNCLKVAGIRTVGELVQKKEEELLAVKNFGRKSLSEIKERLKDMGLALNTKT